MIPAVECACILAAPGNKNQLSESALKKVKRDKYGNKENKENNQKYTKTSVIFNKQSFLTNSLFNSLIKQSFFNKQVFFNIL